MGAGAKIDLSIQDGHACIDLNGHFCKKGYAIMDRVDEEDGVL
jgi:hypothetical protein